MRKIVTPVFLLFLFLAALPFWAAEPTSQISTEAQPLGKAHIISGPSVGHISGSTVTVTWVTDKAKPGLVKWGASKGHYNNTLKETAAVTNHSLTITGLSQHATYHYKVKTGIAHSADATFTTANYSDAPFTFSSMGDNRGPSDQADMVSVTPSFQNILNTAVAMRPAFTIHVGDFYFGYANLADTQQMYSVFKDAIQPLAAIGPFTITPGNHEMTPPCVSLDSASAASCTPAYDPFALFNQEMPGQPQNGPPGYVGTCFSFDSGNTHVASIDTCRFNAQLSSPVADFYDLSDAEIAWLDADLTQAQQAHFRHLFVFGHAEAWSADGVRWTSGSSGTQADLYAETGKVAVGASGTILTSQDGITWTRQTSGTTSALRDVVQGILLVAVGDSGTILTSPDGTTWTARASKTSANLKGAANLLPYTVVVGSSGTILTSLDGITWTAAVSPTSQDLNGITKGSLGSQPLFRGGRQCGHDFDIPRWKGLDRLDLRHNRGPLWRGQGHGQRESHFRRRRELGHDPHVPGRDFVDPAGLGRHGRPASGHELRLHLHRGGRRRHGRHLSGRDRMDVSRFSNDLGPRGNRRLGRRRNRDIPVLCRRQGGHDPKFAGVAGRGKPRRLSEPEDQVLAGAIEPRRGRLHLRPRPHLR